MKRQSLLIIFLLFLLSCSQDEKNTQRNLPQDINKENFNKRVEFVNFRTSSLLDTIFCEINIKEKGKKINFGKIDTSKICIKETGFNNIYNPRFYSINEIGGQYRINKDLTILILMDISSSIHDSLIEKQLEAVRKILTILPNNKIYLSVMNAKVTESILISNKEKSGYNALATIIKETYQFREMDKNSNKFLYKALLSKVEELSGLPQTYYPAIQNDKILSDTAKPKMLFVLTDGKMKDGLSYIGGAEDFNKLKLTLTNEIPEKINKKEIPNIPIHCIYFGDKNNLQDIEIAMQVICKTGGEGVTKGEFHPVFNADSIQKKIFNIVTDLEADYEVVLLNPNGKTYTLNTNTLQLLIENEQKQQAYGEKDYARGNKLVPVVVGENKQKSKWTTIEFGLLFGIFFISILYFILQFLIPFIKFKNFKKKYIKPFKISNDDINGNSLVTQKCYFCKKDIKNAEKVVVKCKHTVHLDCWEANRDRCPEYGKNCREGIHYYNQKHLTDLRNTTHLLPWILYGLISGMLSWVILKIIFTDKLFSVLISFIIKTFYPLTNKIPLKGIDPDTISEFITKTQSLLLTGILLGFFLTFSFSYFIEFRKKTLKILFGLLLRSIFSSILGFITFLAGAIVIIIAGKSTNCLWIDWIPWLFFASGMAFILSFKTEIKFKSSFIGGVISVLFSFIILYLSTFAQGIIGMFSYMFYSAGLGMAIAVVHFISEKYFLHTEGPMKERDIAIYKWMDVSGGFNKVTIGKSIDCIIQINWDSEGDIAEKQVELYLENDRPYCKALEAGTFLANGRVLNKDEVILLTHGTLFKIGNTTFTYVEKDK